MRTMLVPAALAMALAAGPLTAGPTQARSCLTGAAVGGVAGHFLGRHTILGAGIGCVIGHHEATKRAQERALRRQEQLRYGYGGR